MLCPRYYVFSETGESSWFPPKWIDVYDDNTGYYYYTNTKVRGGGACPFTSCPLRVRATGSVTC